MQNPPPLPPKYDPNDPEAIRDPYRVYAQLRRAGRLCRGGPGQWFVTRYDDVAALLREQSFDHRIIERYQRFSPEEPVTGFFQSIIFERDPPQHDRLRKMFVTAFDASHPSRLRSKIGALVDELLEPALERRYFDAVSDFAALLPGRVVGELLGIPRADLAEVEARARRLSRAFDMRHPPNQDREGANEAVAWLRAYVGALAKILEAKAGEDVLSRMLRVEGVTRSEVVDNAIFLFFSGLETTRDLVATGCAALLSFPDEAMRLRRDPSLAAPAVEEFLRYDAPIQALARLVREPIAVGSRMLRTGRVVMLLIGSANHDEQRFASPERLDIGRRPNPHLSFGGGLYHCLGATVARTSAATAFATLLAKTAQFEAAGEAVRPPSAMFRSYSKIPVALTPN